MGLLQSKFSREKEPQDFSYRFYPFHIKGMRERREDLLYYCYAYYPKVITNLLGLEVFSILAYNWPGNLREIDRVMQFKLSRNEKWGWMDDKNVIKLKMWLYRLILKRFNEYGGDENDIYRYVKKSGLDIRRDFKVFEKLTMPKNALVEITDPALDSDLLKLNPMYIMNKIPEFENAYKGYGLFCYLFGHRSKMNCNIMESIYEGNEFEYDYWKRNSGIFDEKEASLIQTIMMSLKGVKHNTDSSVSILEFWDKLERIRRNGKSELQEATKLNNGQIDFKGIGGLTQKELLRNYYEEQLRISNGNKKIAAKKAGLNYSTYYSSLKRVGVKIRKNSTVS